MEKKVKRKIVVVDLSLPESRDSTQNKIQEMVQQWELFKLAQIPEKTTNRKKLVRKNTEINLNGLFSMKDHKKQLEFTHKCTSNDQLKCIRNRSLSINRGKNFVPSQKIITKLNEMKNNLLSQRNLTINDSEYEIK